jgi:hypothetical protein
MSKVRNMKVALFFGVFILVVWAQTTPASSGSSPYPSDSDVAGIGKDISSMLGGTSNPAASSSGGDLAYDSAALDKLSQ